jgi:hypothetical protein
MAQRGRPGSKNIPSKRHANELAPRMTSPETLSTEERGLFDEIVCGVHPRHFARHQQHLLASYVRVTVRLSHLSDRAPLDEFSELVRLQYSAATRLRLTPQSLNEPKTAARRAAEHYQPTPIDEYLRSSNEASDDETVTQRAQRPPKREGFCTSAMPWVFDIRAAPKV